MARLSEVAMRIHVGLLESSFRRGVYYLSDGMARPGERISPKRDNMMRPLF